MHKVMKILFKVIIYFKFEEVSIVYKLSNFIFYMEI